MGPDKILLLGQLFLSNKPSRKLLVNIPVEAMIYYQIAVNLYLMSHSLEKKMFCKDLKHLSLENPKLVLTLISLAPKRDALSCKRRDNLGGYRPHQQKEA